MGFWSRVLQSTTGGNAFFTPRVTYLGADDVAGMMDPSRLTAAQMWATQPHFRTVVTFIARNIAQLGLHSFERVGETDRRRDRTSPLALALRDVDGQMTRYELIYALVVDLLLYDRAFWWTAQSSETSSGYMIRRLPPTWIETRLDGPFAVGEYLFHIDSQDPTPLKPEIVLAFPGFAPAKMHGSSPTVDTLRDTLREQIEAARYRGQVWKRGGRVSSVLERPKDAAPWSDGARESFREDWYSKFTGNGSKAGGTPILEDGMTLKRIDFSAQEQQFVEAAKLSLSTVAAAFHVNPTMVGLLDNANYSNVREFRKMLYGDTLGPLITQIEDRVNTFLVPRFGLSATHYVEFNIAEKLQGNFEEQATAMQASVGGPWMLRSEARAMMNLPEIDGADELIVPLNVTQGGQASPRDGQTTGGGGTSAPASEPGQATVGGFTPSDIVALVGAAATLIRSGFAPEASLVAVGLDPVEHLGLLPVTVQRPQEVSNPDREIEDALKVAADVRAKARLRAEQAKAGPPEELIQQHAKALRDFFARQGRVVKSRIGAGDEWWDGERWDDELTVTLAELQTLAATRAGKAALDALGLPPEAYDEPRTRAFLSEAARRSAGNINTKTRDDVTAALKDEDADTAVAHVFEVAETSRAEQAAVTAVTFASGFGAVEAGRQQSAGATKTWVVNSGNPRPSHAVMDGETVPIEDDFSNGLPWPGAAGSDAEEAAGCQCSIAINLP